MKTTNFEISKKLKEAGFEDSYIYAWYSDSEGLPWIQEIQHAKPTAVNKYGEEVKLTFTAPAYDLETLLEALPKYVARNSDTCGEKNSLQVCVASKQIYYEDDLGIYKGYRDLKQLFFTTTIDNESLADTAGRLLIKLFEAGIVNFNK